MCWDERFVVAIVVGSFISMTVPVQIESGIALNVWDYEVGGTVAAVDPAQIAEGWWNHVKAAYRGYFPAFAGSKLSSILISELDNPDGEYGEYSIPVGERTGTRAGVTGDQLPPFNSVGVRLTVGTRTTRPGQKRLPITYEVDQTNGNWAAGLLTAVDTMMTVMTQPMVLGAPAALVGLQPVVIKRDRGTGAILASQPVIGWLTNNRVTTQNTRKYNRGM